MGSETVIQASMVGHPKLQWNILLMYVNIGCKYVDLVNVHERHRKYNQNSTYVVTSPPGSILILAVV